MTTSANPMTQAPQAPGEMTEELDAEVRDFLGRSTAAMSGSCLEILRHELRWWLSTRDAARDAEIRAIRALSPAPQEADTMSLELTAEQLRDAADAMDVLAEMKDGGELLLKIGGAEWVINKNEYPYCFLKSCLETFLKNMGLAP